MYTKIEIDFEVFKEITKRRTDENVTPNDVLREVFGLQQKHIENNGKEENGRSWVSKGVAFPHGTKFRAIYKGQTYLAIVVDGGLSMDGKRYRSPSAAAVSITGNAVNGWVFWECKLPGQDTWEVIKNLRTD